MMPVETKHRDLQKVARKYTLIDDVIEGSERVKSKGVTYLPSPNGEEINGKTSARYDAYLLRAVFYSVARHTLDGFSGEIFNKPPTCELPPQLELLKLDATGDGVSLNQLAKKAVRDTLSLGRAGVFVDFPDTSGGVTADQVNDNLPILAVYPGSKIINWRTKRFGSKLLLTLVVLEEEYVVSSDGFTDTFAKRYRVLRLSDVRVYTIQLYEGATIKPAVTPTKGDGKAFDYIPFLFIGSETNDANVDYPPLYDLCDLNLAHYRNSADYEESAFIVGQPTPVFTGLTEAWVDKYFPNGIVLGSRTSVSLPEGASGELLTAEENTMIKEAMDTKERQMVALGAKLVEQKTVQRTATEAGADIASEKSILSTVADNVSQAFVEALRCAADFINADRTLPVFKLNNEFSLNLSSPEALNTAISSWVQSAISFTEMRNVARQAGYAIQEDKEAKAEIQADDEVKLANEVKRMETLGPLENPDDPGNGGSGE